MKKLKNPDKYIRQLKKRISRWEEKDNIARETVREIGRELARIEGSRWFGWKKQHKASVGESETLYVTNLHPGDEVIMVGKITEIHQTLDGNSAVMEFGEVRVRK